MSVSAFRSEVCHVDNVLPSAASVTRLRYFGQFARCANRYNRGGVENAFKPNGHQTFSSHDADSDSLTKIT